MKALWLVALISLLGVIILPACSKDDSQAPAQSTADPASPAAAATPPATPGTPAPSPATAPSAAATQPAPSASTEKPVVLMTTPMGVIKIELYPDKAPITVKNFLSYVDARFYDGTFFHRIIPTFMIQGGGFEPGLHEKPTQAAIKNESDNGLSNERGTIAMARTSDPDSATAQFFINVVDNKSLDRAMAQDGVGYCVFGRVIEGMDVVDKIKAVETTTQGDMEDVPANQAQVVITSLRCAEK